MQVSLSPETAAPPKTELAAISTTYLNLSMLSWGTDTASPGGLSPYWPAAYPGPCLPIGLFSPISLSALRDKTAQWKSTGSGFPCNYGPGWYMELDRTVILSNGFLTDPSRYSHDRHSLVNNDVEY